MHPLTDLSNLKVYETMRKDKQLTFQTTEKSEKDTI